MKNTVKTIIYFIVMIGINFGQCFGMNQNKPGNYGASFELDSTKPQKSEVVQFPLRSDQNPLGQNPIYTNYDAISNESRSKQIINSSSQCFGSQVSPSAPLIYPEQLIYITTEQFDALTQRLIVLESANKKNNEINDNIEEFINNLLQQQIAQNATIYFTREELNQIINKMDTQILTLERTTDQRLQQYFQHNVQTYCTKQESTDLINKMKQLETILQNLQTTQTGLQTQLSQFQTQLSQLLIQQLQKSSDQNLEKKQEPEKQELEKNADKLPTQIIINNHGAQAQATNNASPKINTAQSAIEIINNPRNFYSTFITVKNLLATIFILGALIQEGPIGAAVVAIPIFALGAFLNKEAVKDYMNKIAIISCGSVVAAISCIVAYTTYDKDVKLTAIIFVPVSIGLTALFAKM